MNGIRQHRLRAVLRGGLAIIALGVSGVPWPVQPQPMPRMTTRYRTG
jgi:hypothetical protein